MERISAQATYTKEVELPGSINIATSSQIE
jgi:hypothetical protein